MSTQATALALMQIRALGGAPSELPRFVDQLVNASSPEAPVDVLHDGIMILAQIARCANPGMEPADIQALLLAEITIVVLADPAPVPVTDTSRRLYVLRQRAVASARFYALRRRMVDAAAARAES